LLDPEFSHYELLQSESTSRVSPSSLRRASTPNMKPALSTYRHCCQRTLRTPSTSPRVRAIQLTSHYSRSRPRVSRNQINNTQLQGLSLRHKTTMSYSNADTGGQQADPYKEKNLDNEASLSEKINDLVGFAEKQKFCMMTTRIADSGLLVSRCMALAAKVHSMS
jgi:hypothetical protein